MRHETKTAPLSIQIIATLDQRPLLHATLTGSTPATGWALNQMIYQWLSAAQGVMTGSTGVGIVIDETTGSEAISKLSESSGQSEFSAECRYCGYYGALSTHNCTYK